jgi:hypothetical protein
MGLQLHAGDAALKIPVLHVLPLASSEARWVSFASLSSIINILSRGAITAAPAIT